MMEKLNVQWMEQHNLVEEAMKEMLAYLEVDGTSVQDQHYQDIKAKYNEHLSCRNEIQEKMVNAVPIMGRPPIGITKKVSVTLPQDEWDYIAELKENELINSVSEYFRDIHTNSRHLSK